ncbi:MAG: beta strand repeat-containing protein, partial [Bacteroidota bacterium]
MRFLHLIFPLLFAVQLHAQSQEHTGIGLLGRWQWMNEPDRILAPGRVITGPKYNTRQPVSTTATPTLLSMGSSANIFTSAFGPKTNLFAEPALNTVMMVFRSDPSAVSDPNSGYLRYSFSSNGGASFSFNSGPLYVPGTGRSQARYPQCAIYNPPGNTLPSASYATFFAPSLTNTGNGGWGGHAHGARLLNSGTAISLQESDSTFLIPDGGAMNTSDKTFWVSTGLFNRITGQYIDTILLGKGVWNAGQYQYTYQKVFAPIGIAPDGKKKLEGTSIAWGNGGVGYFALLCHESFNAVPQLNLYPIVFKTNDNGVTWEKVASLDLNSFGSYFQTAANYTMGFDFDLIVDANNNLHIVGAIGQVGSQPFTISTVTGTWGMFDLYTNDGGENWLGQVLGLPKSFRGEWTDATVLFEDNRPQASRSADGTKLFFTWFDTDPLVYSTPQNIFPDVIVTGLNLSNGLWKTPENLTDSSIAAGLCTFGNVSPFTLLNASTGCHKIPVSFSQLMGSFNDPVDHYYIGDLEVCNSSFTQPGSPISLVNFSNWAGVIIGDSSVCEATTKSYSIDPLIGATQYTWTVPPGTTILTGQGDTTITVRFGPNSGIISVVASDNLNSLGSSVFPVTVKPVSIAVSSSNSAICPNGGRSTLTASGGATYNWSPVTGLTSSTGSIVTAAPTTTTTYTVTGTAANGCSRTASVTITALPLPAVTASATGPLSFCAGDSVFIRGVSATAISYQWRRNGTNILGQTDSTIVVKTTGNYRVVVTNSFGCTAQSAALSVVVSPLPAVGFTATPGTSICTLDSVRLNGTGALTYSWTGGIGNDTAFFLQPGTATYIVTGTDINGCTNKDTAEITVAAIPQLSVSGNQVICLNDTASITASGANSYTWSPSTGLNTSSGAQIKASPTSSTTYTLVGFNGCTNSISVAITVNPLPPVNSSPAVSICAGKSTTLSASGALSYSWSPVTGLTNSTAGTTSASPASTTQYTVTGTDANGCKSTANTTVTVNVLPAVGYSAIPGNEICGPGNITLNGTGAQTYVWSGGITNGQTLAVSSNATYTVTGTGANGCTNTATVPLAVNALPILGIQGQTEICAGDSTTLTASGATSYTWSPATGINTTTGSIVKLSPASNTTYTLVGFNGCVDSTQVTVVVRQRPNVSGGTNKSVCPGFSATLTATGASTYVWSPASGLNSTTGASVISSPDSTTLYSVIGTDVNGCLDTAQVTVTVKPLPNISYSASPSSELCGSGLVTLSGTGGTTYVWSGGVTNGQPFTVNSSGSYTVTGTGSNGCTNTATAAIAVNSLPVVNVTGVNTLCAGNSTTLAASGATSYTWSPSTGLNTSTGETVIATPTTTTTYTVVGNNGCLDTAQYTVTVNSLPNVSAGANSNLCLGKSRTLTATGASTYTWSPLTGLSAGTGTSVVATPDTTTTYTVTGTDLNGCSKTATVRITILALPEVDATITGDTIFCRGGNTALSASGAVSYLWTPNVALNGNTTAVVTASPTSTTVYTVRGTGSNGCTRTDSVTVNVWQLPVVSGGANTSICIGGNTSLNASGASSYSWSPGTGLSTVLGPVVNASPISTQTYTVTGTDLNGCIDTAIVTVTVNTLPTLSNSGSATICIGSSTNLSVSGATTYQWSPSSGLSAASGSSVSASPAVTTTYTITGTNVNGCVNSDSITVYVNPLPVISTRSDTAICSSNSIILTASGGISYSWSPATGLGNTTGTSVQATPSATTSYIVTGTNLNGCINRDTVTITVNTSPVIVASSNTSICLGDSAILTASGAPSLIWTPPSGLSSTNGSPVKASPA